MATTRSGNPAKKAAAKAAAKQLVVSSVDEWEVDADGVLTELPSGKVVRIITPGMQEFLRAELIPNDLLPIVMRATNGQGSDDELKAIQDDPTAILKMADAMDKIFIHCVVEPKFSMPPADGSREKGVAYVDRVELQDKTFVFQAAVGGTRDLESFRQQQVKGVAALQSS